MTYHHRQSKPTSDQAITADGGAVRTDLFELIFPILEFKMLSDLRILLGESCDFLPLSSISARIFSALSLLTFRSYSIRESISRGNYRYVSYFEGDRES